MILHFGEFCLIAERSFSNVVSNVNYGNVIMPWDEALTPLSGFTNTQIQTKAKSLGIKKKIILLGFGFQLDNLLLFLEVSLNIY